MKKFKTEVKCEFCSSTVYFIADDTEDIFRKKSHFSNVVEMHIQ